MNQSKPLFALLFCVLFGGTLLAALPLMADESDALYGQGVHAFFDRNYEDAVKILSKAEELKSADPRPYYFLGLAYLRQKKTEQADQSFKKAAKLEFSGRAARDYAVSEALRRIQGTERLRIEKIRAEERTNAQKQSQRLQDIRYGEQNAAGKALLQKTMPPTPKEDLAALQQITASFSGNTFGAKPIDPTQASEEIITVQRTENNPFGEVVIREDTLPEIVAIKPIERSIAASGQENAAPQAAASPVRQAQAAAAKGFGRSLRTFFANASKAEPQVVTLEPANGAADVDAAAVKEIRITFDVDMDTETSGWLIAGASAPTTTGEPAWVDAKTCSLPVELEPGKSYVIGISTPDKGFQSKEGVLVRPVRYQFTTL